MRGYPYPGDSRRNETGNSTRAWQDRLREAGFLNQTVSTGVHDPDTALAFKDLREHLGYEAKGDEPKTGGTEGLWTAWAKDEAPEAVEVPVVPTEGPDGA